MDSPSNAWIDEEAENALQRLSENGAAPWGKAARRRARYTTHLTNDQIQEATPCRPLPL